MSDARGDLTEREVDIPDSDGDGLSDLVEHSIGTDPDDIDTDGDGIGDGREVSDGGDPLDADDHHGQMGDGDTQLHDDPYDFDQPVVADGRLPDGILDVELQSSNADTALDHSYGDGNTNVQDNDIGSTTVRDDFNDGDVNVGAGTQPIAPAPTPTAAPTGKADSDGDGLLDDDERTFGTDPFSPDSDRDGLDDASELDVGTDPLAADTDGDGVGDYYELKLGTDPNDAGDVPDDDAVADFME